LNTLVLFCKPMAKKLFCKINSKKRSNNTRKMFLKKYIETLCVLSALTLASSQSVQTSKITLIQIKPSNSKWNAESMSSLIRLLILPSSPAVYECACPSVCPNHNSIWSSIYLSISSSILQYVCLTICPSDHLSISV
jgi:hypothetical protein